MNEPISDTVRNIRWTHCFIQKIANRNHYPAIDILASISRAMPNIVSKEHLQLSNKIKELLSIYNESEDLINMERMWKEQTKKLMKLSVKLRL